jgi:peptidyl-dipeptidase Dcp
MQRRTFLQSVAAAGVLSGLKFSGLAFAAEGADDVLLAPWTGEFGGTPPWDKVNVPALKPAVLKGMDMLRGEINAIVAVTEPPTFENTILAMEKSGAPLDRVQTLFGVFSGNMSSDEMKALETEMAPIGSAFQDEIVQNEALFARIKAVYDSMATAGFTVEQQQVVDNYYKRFTRRGALLNTADKARLKDLNQQLAALYTKFGQNTLADEENLELVLTEADLDGLPDNVKQAAAAAGEASNRKGQYIFGNTRSAMAAVMTYSTRRDLREKAWRLFTNRGDNPGEHDNKPVIVEILKLRQERAKLLGFASHAHWAVDNNMAKTPDAAMALMMKVWPAARARAMEEVKDMQAAADTAGDKITIEPWDYRYYAEKVRKAKYDVDENEVKPYLQLDKIRAGMFWAVKTLYGTEFNEIHGPSVYEPTVTVWEVTRDGKRVGLWYYDPYARKGKRSGAWMNGYRDQNRIDGDITPIVSNNQNAIPAAPGQPVLLSWDDAETMFHEFGHGMHGLLSNVTYPAVSGTSVKRDFVEFPSQIHERWLSTPEVINVFALHADTGAAMPTALFDKIKAAKNFNQGFDTVEYLAAALYDMKIHLAAANGEIDPAAFEKSCMEELGMPKEIVMRHRPTQFGHIFSGDGYSAGYYVYLWADTLSADVWEVFAEKGPYDTATAKLFHDTIMSVGSSVPADQAFRNFRGRDVDTDALMRARGFV